MIVIKIVINIIPGQIKMMVINIFKNFSLFLNNEYYTLNGSLRIDY